MLRAASASGVLHILLYSMLTMMLWPGTIIIPITDEESEVLPRDNPPALPLYQAVLTLPTRIAHCYPSIQGGWIFVFEPKSSC